MPDPFPIEARRGATGDYEALADAVAELAAMQADQQKLLGELITLVGRLVEELSAADAGEGLRAAVGDEREAVVRQARQARRRAQEVRGTVSMSAARAAGLAREAEEPKERSEKPSRRLAR